MCPRPAIHLDRFHPCTGHKLPHSAAHQKFPVNTVTDRGSINTTTTCSSGRRMSECGAPYVAHAFGGHARYCPLARRPRLSSTPGPLRRRLAIHDRYLENSNLDDALIPHSGAYSIAAWPDPRPLAPYNSRAYAISKSSSAYSCQDLGQSPSTSSPCRNQYASGSSLGLSTHHLNLR